MRANRLVLLSLGLVICLASYSTAREAREITCIGNVVDEQGRPIAGVKVTFYKRVYGETTYSSNIRPAGEAETRTDGGFSFSTNAESVSYRHGYIVAERKGLALGLACWDMWQDQDMEIKLGEPKELTGIVVDEDGKPIVGAEVGISRLWVGSKLRFGEDLLQALFKARTDSSGKFIFTGLPEDAAAEYLVKKAGLATIDTYRYIPPIGSRMHFVAGQADTHLVVPPEARIEGVVVKKDTGEPLAGVKLTAMQDWGQAVVGRELPITTREDGTFGIDALAAGKYRLQPARYREGPADWATEPVEVITKAGKTSTGVKVELSKGGLLQVAITEAVSKEPVERANVVIQHQQSGRYILGCSEKNGIARIRLMPGGYQVLRVVKQGYTSDKRRETATIEYGKTTYIRWRLVGQLNITGVVRDEKGKPIEGAELRVCPIDGRSSTSDAEGKFEVKILSAERKHNIHVSAEGYGQGHIEINTNYLVDNHFDVGVLTLPPANLSLSGIVLDVNDAPVAGALVSCQGPSQPYRTTRTDTEGKFVLEKICNGKVRISARTSSKQPLYGYIESSAGASDVKLAVSVRGLNAMFSVPEQSSSSDDLPWPEAYNELAICNNIPIVLTTPSLVGRPLPELRPLKIEFSTDTSNKMILVCFWDMEQRPSRHCIRQLAENSEDLAEKGVIVVSVQSSGVDEKWLKEWVKEYKIPFPSGTTTAEAGGDYFTWGVKSLPWLILTDRQHVVQAEGFSLAELGEKLKGIN
ncbi:MAG: hypothetical protein CEE38_09140 [Planctomycetes bacterium B3_Pla]|nr:MAG: hypothetical protein CEE38_09140 [Planctomycetes bacterium B3_Pla]